MKNRIRALAWAAFTAFCLTALGFAQTSVTITGPPPGNSYDGIYVSPYYATVGGVANTPITCDDFADETHPGSTWNVTITPFSNSMTNTAWTNVSATNSGLYGAAGWLTQQILAAAPYSNNQIIYSFALWALFDPQGVESYLASNPITSGPLTTAQLCDDIFGDTTGCTTTTISDKNPTMDLLYTATTSGFTASQFGMYVLSPDLGNTTTVCTAESKGATACPAQEFLMVPEGGAALAYLLIAALSCFAAMLFRSRRKDMGSAIA